MRPQPSCATASREFPDILTPISTLVKQTCAGLGTPGVSHQLAKPDLIGIELQIETPSLAGGPLRDCCQLLTVHQCGNVACYRADEEGISSALQEAALTDEDEEEQQEVAEGADSRTLLACSIAE